MSLRVIEHNYNLETISGHNFLHDLIFQEDKIAVIVGTVTDDVRLFDVPKLRVVALRFTETARARILKVAIPPPPPPGTASVLAPARQENCSCRRFEARLSLQVSRVFVGCLQMDL